MFTTEEKLAAIKREIRFRRKVYPRLIDKHRITQQFADQQLRIFEAIAQDLRELAAADRLL